MGALPVKKLTRSRQGKRFSSYKLKPVHPSRCPQCRSARFPHVACPNCGYYKGRQVISRGEG